MHVTDFTVNQFIHCSRISTQNCCVDSIHVTELFEPKVNQLWELDAIGIKDDKYTPSETNALQKFADKIEYNQGKYWV